jgi:anti-sigma-K factor RskA
MHNTEHVEELIALYALGGLDDGDAGRVSEHLATCESCRRLADETLATVALLPYAAPPVMPAAETKARLMARVQGAPAPAEARPAPARARTDVAAERGDSFLERLAAAWRQLAPVLATASLVLALVLTALNLSLLNQLSELRRANAELAQRVQEQDRNLALLSDENRTLAQRLVEREQRLALLAGPNVVARDLSGTELAPQASGRIYFQSSETGGLLLVYGLTNLSSDEVYQFWMIGASGPESAGLLRVGADGSGELSVTLNMPFNRYLAVGVSREPAGGSAQPTRIVLQGGL